MSLWRLTGGRPMRREGMAFIDRVSGETVSYWRDRLGREWLATGVWGWALFRVSRSQSTGQPHDPKEKE